MSNTIESLGFKEINKIIIQHILAHKIFQKKLNIYSKNDQEYKEAERYAKIYDGVLEMLDSENKKLIQSKWYENNTEKLNYCYAWGYKKLKDAAVCYIRIYEQLANKKI